MIDLRRFGAFLVCDGGEEVKVPAPLGRPGEDQMYGTPAEKLAELAYRVRFDSLRYDMDGEIRRTLSSQKAHFAMGCAKDWSYYGHYGFVAESEWPISIGALINRRGLRIIGYRDGYFTFDLRSIFEWEEVSTSIPFDAESEEYLKALGIIVRDAVYHYALSVVPQVKAADLEWAKEATNIDKVNIKFIHQSDRQGAIADAARISLYLATSRAVVNEVGKRGDYIMLTERNHSTCGEVDAADAHPPVVTQFTLDEHVSRGDRKSTQETTSKLVEEAKSVYAQVEETIVAWRTDIQKQDPGESRHIARAAAAHYLPGVIMTEALVTASPRQWTRMINQFKNSYDTAMKEFFLGPVVTALLNSRYKDLVWRMLK